MTLGNLICSGFEGDNIDFSVLVLVKHGGDYPVTT